MSNVTSSFLEQKINKNNQKNNNNFKKIGQSGGTSRWRVYYPTGLPRLFSRMPRFLFGDFSVDFILETVRTVANGLQPSSISSLHLTPPLRASGPPLPPLSLLVTPAPRPAALLSPLLRPAGSRLPPLHRGFSRRPPQPRQPPGSQSWGGNQHSTWGSTS